MIRLGTLPQFDGTLTEKNFALWMPSKNQYVKNVSERTRYSNDTKYLNIDTNNSPRFMKEKGAIMSWQMLLKEYNYDSEIVEIEIIINKVVVNDDEILEHMTKIKNGICINRIDGKKLHKILEDSPARYLVFSIPRSANGDHDVIMKQNIKFVKETMGKTIKCIKLDISTKTFFGAAVFSSDDINACALLKLISQDVVEVYDKQEKKFL